jgi:hypothetical protein
MVQNALGLKLGIDDEYNAALAELSKLKHTQASGYVQAIRDLRNMATGGDAGGVRWDQYEGWEDDDFLRLLGDLGEALSL